MSAGVPSSKKIGLFNIAHCVNNSKNDQKCANFNDNAFKNNTYNISNRQLLLNNDNLKNVIVSVKNLDNVNHIKKSPICDTYKGFESYNIFDVLCDEYVLDDDVFLPAEGDQRDSSPSGQQVVAVDTGGASAVLSSDTSVLNNTDIDNDTKRTCKSSCNQRIVGLSQVIVENILPVLDNSAGGGRKTYVRIPGKFVR
jgi:hypothetical protein